MAMRLKKMNYTKRITMKNASKIKAVALHRNTVETMYELYFGKAPLRAKLHDLDKLVMLVFGVKPATASKIHRKMVKHHRLLKKPHKMKWDDKIEVIMDWESARFTKPDKPLNARDTMDKHYPYLKDYLTPTLDSLGL